VQCGWGDCFKEAFFWKKAGYFARAIQSIQHRAGAYSHRKKVKKVGEDFKRFMTAGASSRSVLNG